MLVLLFVQEFNWIVILMFIWFYCYYCWIQTNKCWLSLRNYSFNVFGNCGKYRSYGLGNLLGYMFLSFSPNIQRIRIQKNKFSQQCFREICVTLVYIYIYIYIYVVIHNVVIHNGLKVLLLPISFQFPVFQ